MPVHQVCAWCPQRLEEDSDPLELELETVVSCHMGARSRTQVLCKNSQCS